MSFRQIALMLGALATGIAIGTQWRAKPVHASAATAPELIVKLHRFQIKPDQMQEFDRWIAFEHAHHDETVATLEREHMYVESIFRDREHDPKTIYWAEVRGAGGASVDTSPLPIDKVYDEYMHKTLVPGSHTTLQPEYTLLPPFLLERIRAHQLGQSAGRQ